MQSCTVHIHHLCGEYVTMMLNGGMILKIKNCVANPSKKKDAYVWKTFRRGSSKEDVKSQYTDDAHEHPRKNKTEPNSKSGWQTARLLAQGPVSCRPTTLQWRQFSQSNRHSIIGTWQTEYHEALPSLANDEVRCDCTFADDGNASWYSVCRVVMVEWWLDCENCRHLTVIGLHNNCENCRHLTVIGLHDNCENCRHLTVIGLHDNCEHCRHLTVIGLHDNCENCRHLTVIGLHDNCENCRHLTVIGLHDNCELWKLSSLDSHRPPW